jgi:hypothetical protein
VAVNERGGKQSATIYRFYLMDPAAMFNLAEVLGYGAAKYGIDNWRNITTQEHLNHLLQHVYAWLAGDKQDNHLGHALCRAMFALAMELQGGTPSRRDTSE